MKINESITRDCNSCDKTDYLIGDSYLPPTAGNKKIQSIFPQMRSKKVEPFDLIRINRLKILVYKSNYHLIFIKPLFIDV